MCCVRLDHSWAGSLRPLRRGIINYFIQNIEVPQSAGSETSVDKSTRGREVGGFGYEKLVLYGTLKIAGAINSLKLSTNGSRASLELDQ